MEDFPVAEVVAEVVEGGKKHRDQKTEIRRLKIVISQ